MYQSVFISGVSGKLGLSIAKRLISNSLVNNLYVQVRSDRHDALLKDLAVKYKVNVHIEHFDIRDNKTLKLLLARALEHGGKTLVIANAGISLSKNSDSFLEDDFEIDRAFDVNAKGTIKTLYYALNTFLDKNANTQKSQDHAVSVAVDNNSSIHLVAISSLASLLPMRSSPLYSASKVAVNYYITALNASIPSHLRSYIKTTLVLPGFINTNMSQRFIGSKSGMISSDKAAKLIVTALSKEKKIFAFPLYLYLGIKLSYFVPNFILKYIMKAFDFSVEKDKERVEFETRGVRYEQRHLSDIKKE